MINTESCCHGLFCRYSYVCERYLSTDDSQPFIDPPIVNKNGYCNQLIGHKIDPQNEVKNIHFRDMYQEGLFHMWRLSWSKDQKNYGKLTRNNHV
jgi:hypothetical protein